MMVGNNTVTRSKLIELASRFEQTAKSSSSTTASTTAGIPTALMIYQTGKILYECQRQISTSPSTSTANRNDNGRTPLHHGYLEASSTFDTSMKSISRENLMQIIGKDLASAFRTVSLRFQSSGGNDSTSVEDCHDALRALCGVYCHSKVACDAGFDETFVLEFVRLYDHLMEGVGAFGDDDGKEEVREMKECIFRTLSCLLIDGLISPIGKRLNRDGGDDDDDGSEDDALREILNVVQNLLSSSGQSCCLGDLQEWQQNQQQQQQSVKSTKKNQMQSSTRTLVDAVQATFPNENPSRDYLLMMLSTATKSSELIQQQQQQQSPISHPTLSKPTTKTNNKTTTTKTARQRLIDQVISVLPDLGEGYVETALACYQNDPDATIASLLEGQSDPSLLHPRLRVLDPKLPARRKASRSQYGAPASGTAEQLQDEEAKRVQKERLRHLEKNAEEEAYLLSAAMERFGDEYDDDYDDQYDGVGIDADDIGGRYDDADAIRVYNRVAKEIVSDGAFWEENRNQNRNNRGTGGPVHSKKKNKKDINDNDGDDDDKSGEEESRGDAGYKKYRGPDKGKGGRAIGPDGKYLPIKKGRKKAGGGANGGTGAGENKSREIKGVKGPSGGAAATSSSTANGSDSNMTKIQKRRKNDNKAKIGNHHRKERAAKKAGAI